MPDERKKPDLKTFLEDPAFQGDRELFAGFVDHHLAAKEAAAKKKADDEAAAKAVEDAKKPKSIFDW